MVEDELPLTNFALTHAMTSSLGAEQSVLGTISILVWHLLLRHFGANWLGLASKGLKVPLNPPGQSLKATYLYRAHPSLHGGNPSRPHIKTWPSIVGRC
jgi:hypothetical protein